MLEQWKEMPVLLFTSRFMVNANAGMRGGFVNGNQFGTIGIEAYDKATGKLFYRQPTNGQPQLNSQQGGQIYAVNNDIHNGKIEMIAQNYKVTISRQGQMAMKEILAVYLRRIEWDNGGKPVRLFPFTRDRYGESPELIAIDPRIRFGKPCISGTRIPTSIIAERHQAGDSIELLATDYGRKAEEIEEAIRYESRIAA